jgi:L-fuconate dehydratase
MSKITGFRTIDVRFPTSNRLDGSDAMNQDPNYSAAYLILETDDPDLTGHSLVFTIGRGNDLECAAIDLLAEQAVGREVGDLAASMGDIARGLVRDSQTYGRGCRDKRALGSDL